MSKPISVRIAGIGGQGNLLAGYLLSKAFVKSGKYVIQTQNYSEQVRGGPSYCDVLFCEDEILFPKAVHFDSLIIMHPSMIQQIKQLRTNGILIYDNTYITSVPKEARRITKRVIAVPASKEAVEKFGGAMFSNMILLGVFLKTTDLIDLEVFFDTLKEEVNPKYFEKNKEAILFGYSLTDKIYRPRVQRKLKRTIGFE